MVIRPDKNALGSFLGTYVAAQFIPAVGEEARELLWSIEPRQVFAADLTIRPVLYGQPFLPAGEAPASDIDDDGIKQMASLWLASGVNSTSSAISSSGVW